MRRKQDSPELKPTKILTGKPRLTLVSPHFIRGMAEVLQHAIDLGKYDKNSWMRGIPFDDSLDATMRHIDEFREGIMRDPETGKNPLYHAACNLMFLTYFIENGMDKFDDRTITSTGKEVK